MKSTSGLPVATGPLPFFLRPFHVLAKPVGATCNLSCRYCYYLEKQALYPAAKPVRMSEAVLEKFVCDYLGAHPADAEVAFAWQGGEPNLAGRDFFERVVALQRRHAGGRRVTNALQTNGTLLDDAWGEFLRREKFLVGVSLDGPQALHDAHRRDRGGGPTFERVMAGLEVLKRHGVPFNLVTAVTRSNAERPLAVYRFLRETGAGQLQFNPVVERTAGSAEKALSLRLAAPPRPTDSPADREHMLTLWSVRPEQYGEFLNLIFDEWVRRDVGRVRVQQFESALSQWLGGPAAGCVHERECGRGVALEHDGSLYACDHYVYADHRLGDIRASNVRALLDSERQEGFGRAKQAALPRQCRECAVGFACNGGCPKLRFIHANDGEPGLNYLCTAYKAFFHHVDPALVTLGGLLGEDRAPAEIMRLPRSKWRRGRL